MAADLPPLDGRAPRLLIAGEFSSGKTALINAILGEPLLPSAVTATSMPPVWLAYGEPGSEIHFLDGRVMTFASIGEMIAEAGRHEVEDILIARVNSPSPALVGLDLIDTPGSSDPNIPTECWQRVRALADMILWCSNSTQAWRQSEKSSWLEVPDDVAQRSLLVLTHADRLDDASREKVYRRVQRDAAPLFHDILTASAMQPDSVQAVIDKVRAIAAGMGGDLIPDVPVGLDLAGLDLVAQAVAADPSDEAQEPQPRRVQPRRVRPNGQDVATGEPEIVADAGFDAASEADVDAAFDADVDAASDADSGTILTAGIETLVEEIIPEPIPEQMPEPIPELTQAKPRQIGPDRTLWVVDGGANADAVDPDAGIELDHDPLLDRLASLAVEAGMAEPEPDPDHATVAPVAAMAVVGSSEPEPEASEPHPHLDQAFGPAALAWGRIDGTFDPQDQDAWADAVLRLIEDIDGALAAAWTRHRAPAPLAARRDRAAQR